MRLKSGHRKVKVRPMIKIRLTRTGAKNAPSYRIVAVDSREKRDGESLEILGHYNPSNNPPTFEYNKERLEYWRSVGAQLTEAVEKLITSEYKYVKYEPRVAEKEDSEKVAAEVPATESQPEAKEVPPAEENEKKAEKQPTEKKM